MLVHRCIEGVGPQVYRGRDDPRGGGACGGGKEPVQRRSQVSLVGGGGLTEFQGGNKPQYLYL